MGAVLWGAGGSWPGGGCWIGGANVCVWAAMCRDVFGCAGEYVEVDTVLERIIETDTVSSFQPPVEVWIDDNGVHTVLVHDTEGGA
ncbi:MAG: hypothetical protein JSU86_11025 [Phycisphaerales bacterium]|nr:MAG: hypothetical protein JSU86_11025 [Phycisphaerales bacterium]